MNCLVTGGAGFIGSHLVERLLYEGFRVCVLDNLATGCAQNLPEKHPCLEVVEGDITDEDEIRAAIRGCDWVFHLAALPSVQRSIEDPGATHTACATGTLNVLQAARTEGVRRVIYAGSSSAYGGLPGALRREDDPVAPRSPYASAKLAGEMYCVAFTAAYGLETVRLRFFNVFGPRQRADSPYSGVVAQFLGALLERRRPAIYGDGLQSRDFTYVANVVEALLLGATSSAASGQVYNVGAGQSTTVLELLDRLQQIIGTNLTPDFLASRQGDVRSSLADINRARLDLGYQPSVSIEEGLQLTVAAVLAQAHQKGQEQTARVPTRLIPSPAQA